MERETERFVHLLSALASIKQILLNVIADGKQGTAGSICRSIDTVRTCNVPGNGR